jgi:B12-binding domain/radical SAM domain protein of rhizo-twelve system
MKFALVNPNWTFDGSIYFGCREPHLPVEYGYTKALLETDGHEAVIIDGQLEALSNPAIVARAAAARPDIIVVTTAPSYLFWRCAPPELRVPQQTIRDLERLGALMIVVGPHASTTPVATLRKTGADAVVMGECEEIVRELARRPRAEWSGVSSIAYGVGDEVRVHGGPHASDMSALPALHWPVDVVARHRHHHHRFEAAPVGPGAEMEVSRGCPYHCSFCAKENFRSQYRKRPLPVILEELDGLLANGIEYVYFIDEIFLPNRELLEAVATRDVKFGVQTRIDLWSRDMLDLLGRAGCVSIEAGVESISEEGRKLLDKGSKLSTEAISERLIHAKRSVPFVQANLLDAKVDDPVAVDAWRHHLQGFGVWANEPVPLFPYPGSPDYTKLWGLPDDRAWERAVDYYLQRNTHFSDVQNERPVALSELEDRVSTPFKSAGVNTRPT